MYTYVCQIFVLLPTCFSSYEHFSAKHQENPGTWSPVGTSGRGLGAIRTLWSAWQVLKVCVQAGVDKTTSLVSAREAIFCTYASVKIYMLSVFSLGSYELCAHSSDIYQVHNRQYAQAPLLKCCHPHAVRVRHTHFAQ